MESDIALARHVTFVHQFKKNPELDFEPFDPSFLKLYISQVCHRRRFWALSALPTCHHFSAGRRSVAATPPCATIVISRGTSSSPRDRCLRDLGDVKPVLRYSSPLSMFLLVLFFSPAASFDCFLCSAVPPNFRATTLDNSRIAGMQARMLEPHVPEDLTSYIVEAYVALRAQSGQDAKNGDQVSFAGGQTTRTL